jgi:hypothetical protein
MKIGSVRLATASLALMVVQLAIVSTVAAKYLYQRWTCPRVWTRAMAYDPELMMRGRYLSMQLTVDGCESTLPSAAQAQFPRKVDGTVAAGNFTVQGQYVEFPAKIVVKNNRLMAVHERDGEDSHPQRVNAPDNAPCDQMRLVQPVSFYIAEHAKSPFSTQRGIELWVEVTVPPKGPPRPIQLAIKEAGGWKPLAYQ